LQAGEAGDDAGELERAADPRSRPPARRGAPERPPREVHLARRRQDLAAEQAEDGGLAGAVGADENVDVARAHVEVHALDRPERAVMLREATRREHYPRAGTARGPHVRPGSLRAIGRRGGVRTCHTGAALRVRARLSTARRGHRLRGLLASPAGHRPAGWAIVPSSLFVSTRPPALSRLGAA